MCVVRLPSKQQQKQRNIDNLIAFHGKNGTTLHLQKDRPTDRIVYIRYGMANDLECLTGAARIEATIEIEVIEHTN